MEHDSTQTETIVPYALVRSYWQYEIPYETVNNPKEKEQQRRIYVADYKYDRLPPVNLQQE
jgi:hypothetical protein